MTDARTIDGKLLLRIPDAVATTGISRATLYRDIQRQRLKLRKKGRSAYILAGDLIDYVDQLAESA